MMWHNDVGHPIKKNNDESHDYPKNYQPVLQELGMG